LATHFADELFHFVGSGHPNDDERNFGVLLKILGDGCISYKPDMKSWGQTTITFDSTKSLLRNEMVVPNMVCFCDILPKHLGDHVSKYGRFGLSVPKAYAIRYGVRPVMYVPFTSLNRGSPYGTELLREMEVTFKGLREYFDLASIGRKSTRMLGQPPKSADETIEALGGVLGRDLLGFVKAFNAELPDDHLEYFYAEREWRRIGNLKFELAHVVRVAVARGFEARLAAQSPEYADRMIQLPLTEDRS
jgi:hypothetical protein